MSRQLPTAADFICGDQTTLGQFKLNRVIETVVADGVDYHLVYGTQIDEFDNSSKQAYRVVTHDDLVGWRTVLLRQHGHPFGFNYLIGQEVPPKILSRDAKRQDAVMRLQRREMGDLIICDVLSPYQFQFEIGQNVAGRTIATVGKAIFFGDNCSGIVPVQFTDGYDLLFCRGESCLQYHSPTNAEVTRLINGSETMPTILNGIGTEVWHVMVTEQGQDVLLKLFYNSKGARRPDEVHR